MNAGREGGGRGQGKLLPDLLKIFPLALFLEVLGNLLQNFILLFKPHPPEIKPKECCGSSCPATPYPSLL